jgi:hypothetical protein
VCLNSEGPKALLSEASLFPSPRPKLLLREETLLKVLDLRDLALVTKGFLSSSP